MLQRFIEFIEQHQLCPLKSRLFLAVSGGVDSMVLAHLAMLSEFEIHVLHANFQLRESESDQDAHFVQRFCEKNNIACIVRNFPLAKISRDRKFNIQAEARKLRYSWFEDIITQNPEARIATAHHHNDNVETILMNLLRVTGFRGLSGIPVQRGSIIRPLLFANKTEILQYATDENVPYREDSSNRMLQYKRNRIRHRLVPEFRRIEPKFDRIMEKNIRIWNDTAAWMNSNLDGIRRDFIKIEDTVHRIQVASILDSEHLPFLLFELLNPYGFQRDQTDKINKAMFDKKTGARFLSKQYELCINREELILRKRITIIQENTFKIGGTGIFQVASVTLAFERTDPSELRKANPFEAYFDEKKLQFPLILRPWRPGDIFQPLGMEGKHQKVKKFLIGIKLNRFEKEDTMVLISENKICWVVGHRIDHRFRVTPGTKSVIRCLWKTK